MTDNAEDPSTPSATPTDAPLRVLLHELEKRSDLLQATFGTINQGILIANTQGRVTTFNQRLCDLLELPHDLLANHPTLAEVARFQWQRGDFEAEGAKISPLLHNALATGAPLLDYPMKTGAYVRTTRTGRLLEVKTQSMDGGGIVRTVTDVTERKRIDDAVKDSEEMLRQITSQVPGMLFRVYLSDTGTRTYSFVSDGVRDLYGVAPEDVMRDGSLLQSFRHPDDTNAVETEMRTAALSTTPRSMQFRLRLPGNVEKWVQMTSTVVAKEGGGTVRTGVMIDITARKQTEAALRASEDNIRQITSQVPGMVYRVTFYPDGIHRYSFVSNGVTDLYGVTPEAVLADARLLESFRLPEDAEALATEMAQAKSSRLPMLSEFRIRHPLGFIKWVHVTSTWIGDADGGTVRSGVVVDITERKRIELELRETEARWKLALESTGDGMWDWYIQTGVEVYSKRYVEMYGYEEGDFQNRSSEFDMLTHPDDLEQLERDRQAHFDGLTPTYVNEHRVKCKDGSWKWIMTRGMVIERDAADKPVRMIGTHTDITARKQSEALIWRQANFDALTGLPNRRMLRERIEADIARSKQNGSRLAILFIDLDHFKEVNDTLGHAKGDMLLIEAARRIGGQLGEHDTVARMGGDEFTVVLHEGAGSISHTVSIVQGILHDMAMAFQLGDEQVFVSASIGVTVYPQDASEVENLFKNADQALYVAKGAGRNRFSFFTPELQQVALNRARLAADLRVALINQQFFMVYQPIVDLKTGLVRKAEALIRWQHPSRGLISPGDFIPIAEASGLIIEIGDWAFRHVASQTREWRATLNPEFQVSVNKSPAQFHHDGGSNQAWMDYLNSLGLPGSAIAVEITEGLLLDASEGVTTQLLELRDAGVQVSLDDFGTGYSSLSYLQRFDIDYIKIDQSFVRHLIPDSTDLALCKAIIVMAHELGMKVIAEGIETQQQRDLLVAAGCDFGQGYYLARPMSAQSLEVFLSTQPKPGKS